MNVLRVFQSAARIWVRLWWTVQSHVVTEEVLTPVLLPPLPLLILSREVAPSLCVSPYGKLSNSCCLPGRTGFADPHSSSCLHGSEKMPSATRGLFYSPEIPPASRKQIFPPKGICCCLILLVLLGRKSQRTRVNLEKDNQYIYQLQSCNTPAPYQGGYRCCQDLARCSAGSEDLKSL